MQSLPDFSTRSAAPLMRAQSLVHLRHRRRDLAAALRFYSDFGLDLAAEEEGVMYLRAAGGGPICVILEAGRRDEFLGFGVLAAAEDDLHRLADALGGTVAPRHTPGGGMVLRLQDPTGLQVEVLHGVCGAPLQPPPPPVPVNTFARPVRINTPRPVALQRTFVRRLGHVVLGRQELRRNARWYMDTLGLIATDVEMLEELGEPLVAFMRFDRGAQPADHHAIVIATAPEDGYLHAAFEASDVESIGEGAEFLQSQGWVKSWGIGRHVLGSQMFCYHIDPHGFEVEHYIDGDMFDATHQTRFHPAGLPGLYKWGPTMPPHFVDNTLSLGRLLAVLRGLWTRDGFTLKLLLAIKRLYSQKPRPWADTPFVRPRAR